MNYCNPVIPGFYPDPSICRYQEKYYLVNSTFQYFPGVVLWESNDLVNWKQIGHVLTRESQLPLAGAGNAGGIYAPTIRCNNGRFYMVTTNVSGIGNFYVWTDDIYGEWSDPISVEQDGIDPSLYFEGEKCYFMSNGTDDYGEGGIVQCEIDIETGKKLTPSKCIWKGNGGRYLEGPHLYRINGRYVLLAAEGGTEYGHMEICAFGETPYGPFTGASNNPILTNRNLGGYLIQGCGHADLVQDENGNWWMVHLAFRQTGLWQMYHIIGRETCLVPVTFAGSTVLAGENGTTRLVVGTDRLPEGLIQKKQPQLTFDNTKLYREWCMLRNPKTENYHMTSGKQEEKLLVLTETPVTISDAAESPTAALIRQEGMKGEVSVTLREFGEEAGITLYMNEAYHYEIYVKRTEGRVLLQKRISIGDLALVQESYPLSEAQTEDGTVRYLPVTFKITFEPQKYHFSATVNGSDGWKELTLKSNLTKFLSKEVAEGFTGVMIGLYAQGNTGAEAVFGDFCCSYADAE